VKRTAILSIALRMYVHDRQCR